MFCPSCKGEYKEGITRCKDCNVDLVDKLPEEKSSEKITAKSADEVVLLTSVSDTIEADLIVNMLKNNNIPCFKKDKASGGYMNLYMGYSIYGQDIYINQKDYVKAKEICEEVFLKDGEDNTMEEQGEVKIPAYRNSKIISRIILGVAVGMIAISFLINYIVN